jgi:hypothetical protein
MQREKTTRDAPTRRARGGNRRAFELGRWRERRHASRRVGLSAYEAFERAAGNLIRSSRRANGRLK